MDDSNSKIPDKSDMKLLSGENSLEALEMMDEIEKEHSPRKESINTGTYQSGATDGGVNNTENRPLISSNTPDGSKRKEGLPLAPSNPLFQPFTSAERSQIAPAIR